MSHKILVIFVLTLQLMPLTPIGSPRYSGKWCKAKASCHPFYQYKGDNMFLKHVFLGRKCMGKFKTMQLQCLDHRDGAGNQNMKRKYNKYQSIE